MSLRNSVVLKMIPGYGNTLSISLTSILLSRVSASAGRLMRDHLHELEGLGQRIPPLPREIHMLGSIRAHGSDVAMGEQGRPLADGCLLLLQHAGRTWIGVGVHHPAEAAVPPTLECPEPISENRVATSWWAYDDIAPHWDRLTLRVCQCRQGGAWEPMQVGPLSETYRPEHIRRDGNPGDAFPEGTILFCPIAPAPVRIAPDSQVRCELQDEILERYIRLDFRNE